MNQDHFRFPRWMGKFPRANTPWNDKEDRRLVRRWYEGATIAQLREEHGRADGGIGSRLSKLIGDNFYLRDVRVSDNRSEIQAIFRALNDLDLKLQRLLGE